MNEIRIRAWDSKRKKMIYQFYVGSPIYMPTQDDDGTLMVCEEGESERLPIMLYTGKRDCDGRALWEKDRVECAARDADGNKWEFTGMIEWDSDEVGYYILTDNTRWPYLHIRYANWIKKIGSIYENTK